MYCRIIFNNFNSFQVCFVLDCLLVLIWIHGACSKGSEITRWVSIILHTASGYIIKYSNGVSPPSPCQPRTPEPQFLLLPDDIFLFILTAFMTRGAGPVGGGCGLKGRVLTVLTVIIPQMNSNSYRSYLQGSHVAWIMLLRFTMLTRDLRNVIKMWRIPVPDCLCPDKAACQMFRWYDVRNVSHGSDTVSSVANLGLTFAEYSHSRWWAEFVGFAEDYFPLGDYLTLNLRPAKWPATPHVYLQVADRRRVFSVHLFHGSRVILIMSVCLC